MFGSGTIEYTSANETVSLLLKPDSPSAVDGEKQISLLQLAKSTIPPCNLNPLLFNGHLQTMWVTSGQAEDVPIHYKRRIFQSDYATYPGQFTVDFIVDPPAEPLPRDKTLPPRTHNFTEDEFKDFTETDDDSPIIIGMHGISGGSHEQYIRHMLRPLTQKGWSACVINARGCAWSKITTPHLFNARATWDVRQLVKWFKATWPNRKLYIIAFSLGANILTNYLGEEGEACQIEAAIVVGNPWNLDVANSALESSWIGLNVYLAAMGTWLKKLFER
jgi:predicted alpha/beta-fold hydrolase